MDADEEEAEGESEGEGAGEGEGEDDKDKDEDEDDDHDDDHDDDGDSHDCNFLDSLVATQSGQMQIAGVHEDQSFGLTGAPNMDLCSAPACRPHAPGCSYKFWGPFCGRPYRKSPDIRGQIRAPDLWKLPYTMYYIPYTLYPISDTIDVYTYMYIHICVCIPY